MERACADADAAFRRINLEIRGNTDDFLHTHIWPRYEWEPVERIGSPVWLYPAEHWRDSSNALNATHDHLRASITSHLRDG